MARCFVFDSDSRRINARSIVSGVRGNTTLIFQDFHTIATDFGVDPIVG